MQIVGEVQLNNCLIFFGQVIFVHQKEGQYGYEVEMFCLRLYS